MQPHEIRRGQHVTATDAYGNDHPAVVARGPERPRGKGSFWKVWLRFEGRPDDIPWPVESIRLAGSADDTREGTT